MFQTGLMPTVLKINVFHFFFFHLKKLFINKNDRRNDKMTRIIKFFALFFIIYWKKHLKNKKKNL